MNCVLILLAFILGYIIAGIIINIISEFYND
jgi:hypothetical protein